MSESMFVMEASNKHGAVMDNSPFSAEHSSLQLAWDSTSLGCFQQCPRKYQLRILSGWVPKTHGPQLDFGLLFHAAFETYSHALVTMDPEAAIFQTLRGVFSSPSFATLPDEGYYRKEALVRAVVWYFDYFSNDGLEVSKYSDGSPLVEVSFRFAISASEVTGEEILLCGHIDAIGVFSGQTYVIDHKTTKSSLGEQYFSRYSPDTQMSLYSLAGRIALGVDADGVLINGIQTLIEGTNFARGFAHRTPLQLEEFLSDTIEWIRLAEKMAMEGSWPHNTKSCFLCDFRDVCSKDPSVRRAFLEADFTRREWNPLRNR